MKRFLFSCLLGLSLLLTGTAAEGAARSWAVPPDCDTCMINRITNVAAGDTLTLASGNYNVSPAGITDGTAAAPIIIQGVQQLASNGVTIYQNSVFPNEVTISNAKYTRYLGCNFQNGLIINSTGPGLSDSLTISNCTIQNGRFQIYGRVDSMLFEHNTMTGIYDFETGCISAGGNGPQQGCGFHTDVNGNNGQQEADEGGLYQRPYLDLFYDNSIHMYQSTDLSGNQYMAFLGGLIKCNWFNNRLIMDYETVRTTTDNSIYMQFKKTQDLTFRNSYFEFQGKPLHGTTESNGNFAISCRDSVNGMYFDNDTILVTGDNGSIILNTGVTDLVRPTVFNFSFDSCLVYTNSIDTHGDPIGGFWIYDGTKNIQIKNTLWVDGHSSPLFIEPGTRADSIILLHDTFYTEGSTAQDQMFPWRLLDTGGAPYIQVTNCILDRDNAPTGSSSVLQFSSFFESNNGYAVQDSNLFYQPHGDTFPHIARTSGGVMEGFTDWVNNVAPWDANPYRLDSHSVYGDPSYNRKVNPNSSQTTFVPQATIAYGTRFRDGYVGAPLLGPCDPPLNLSLNARGGSPDSTTIQWDQQLINGNSPISFRFYVIASTRAPTDTSSTVTKTTVSVPNINDYNRNYFTFASTAGTTYWFTTYDTDLYGRNSSLIYIFIPKTLGGSGGGTGGSGTGKFPRIPG